MKVDIDIDCDFSIDNIDNYLGNCTINVTKTIYIEKIYDMSDSKYVMMVDLLKHNDMELFSQCIEDEKETINNFWIKNNCLAVMEVINNNDVTQYKKIQKYIHILHLTGLIEYCNCHGLFDLAEYLSINVDINKTNNRWKLKQLYGGKLCKDLDLTDKEICSNALICCLFGKNINNIIHIDLFNTKFNNETLAKIINILLTINEYELFYKIFDNNNKYKHLFKQVCMGKDFLKAAHLT